MTLFLAVLPLASFCGFSSLSVLVLALFNAVLYIGVRPVVLLRWIFDSIFIILFFKAELIFCCVFRVYLATESNAYKRLFFSYFCLRCRKTDKYC